MEEENNLKNSSIEDSKIQESRITDSKIEDSEIKHSIVEKSEIQDAKIQDSKIPMKEKQIAYHSCANRAVEVLGSDFNQKEFIGLRTMFYKDFVDWYNATEAESDVKKCPNCASPLKVIPAGKSKKTGRRYDAFYACDNCKWSGNVEIKKAEPTPKGAVKVETPMPPKL